MIREIKAFSIIYFTLTPESVPKEKNLASSTRHPSPKEDLGLSVCCKDLKQAKTT